MPRTNRWTWSRDRGRAQNINSTVTVEYVEYLSCEGRGHGPDITNTTSETSHSTSSLKYRTPSRTFHTLVANQVLPAGSVTPTVAKGYRSFVRSKVGGPFARRRTPISSHTFSSHVFFTPPMSECPSLTRQPSLDTPNRSPRPRKWANEIWIHITKHIGVGIICSVAYFDPCVSFSP